MQNSFHNTTGMAGFKRVWSYSVSFFFTEYLNAVRTKAVTASSKVTTYFFQSLKALFRLSTVHSKTFVHFAG